MRRTFALAVTGAVHLGWITLAAQESGDLTPVTAGEPVSIAAPLPDAVISSKNLDVEVTPVPGAAAPGAAVRLVYVIYNWEETDERVRLHVVAGPGWTRLDPELEQREWLIEAFGQIEGEIYLTLPDDAHVGERQLVRLLVEVVGESGRVEARSYVSVAKRGGARPGIPTVSGTSTIGVSGLGASGFQDAHTGGALALSMKLGRQGSLSFSYDRGLEQNLSNFRYSEEFTRTAGNLRYAGWDLSFGNRVWSPGDALAGPFVQGVGASVRRTTGRLLGELAVIQPAAFGGATGGHLVRGRGGLKTRRTTLALSVSDFGRPAGGYTTLAPVQETVLDAEAEEELELERLLTAQSPSNRVQGVGLDAELRPTTGHRFALRLGALSLSSTAGARSRALVREGSYAFSAPQKATFNARWRTMPPTLPGIFMPGDEIMGTGSVRLAGAVHVVGRAFQNASETLGREFSSQSQGASLGLRYLQGGRRLDVRANYRESGFTVSSVRRTVSVLTGLPLGPLALSAHAEVGEQDNGRRVNRIGFYRGDLRWVGDAGTASFTVSHSEGAGTRRQRVDVLASLKLAALELAGGAWATRGYLSGGKPGIWASVGVPTGNDLMLTIGIDWAPITWTAEPTWRGMLAIRKGFELPLRFARSGTPPGERAGIPLQTPDNE